MTQVTRTRLDRCATADCPRRDDRDWHELWMERCAKGAEHGHRHDKPTHAHFPKKGMGGNNPNAKIVAVICWPLHDATDNGLNGMGVNFGEVRIWDLHNRTILRGPAPSSEGEVSEEGSPLSPAASPSVPGGESPAEGEAGRISHDGGQDGTKAEGTPLRGSPAFNSPSAAGDRPDSPNGGEGYGSPPPTAEGEARPGSAPDVSVSPASLSAAGLVPDARRASGAAMELPSEAALSRPATTPPGISEPTLILDADWSGLSDNELVAAFQKGHETQHVGFLVKCKAVGTFREKHEQRHGKKWVEAAYAKFQESRRVLPYYARTWQIFCAAQGIYRENVGLIDKGLLRTFGRLPVTKALEALEGLTSYIADYGEVPSPRDLQKRLAGSEPEVKVEAEWMCPSCACVFPESRFKETARKHKE